MVPVSLVPAPGTSGASAAKSTLCASAVIDSGAPGGPMPAGLRENRQRPGHDSRPMVEDELRAVELDRAEVALEVPDDALDQQLSRTAAEPDRSPR